MYRYQLLYISWRLVFAAVFATSIAMTSCASGTLAAEHAGWREDSTQPQ